MTAQAIDLDGVVRRFGEVTAVDRVTFHVRPGEIFGLLGHNGAGKTTMIRLITGLLRPDEGRITTLGHDPVIAGELVRTSTGVLTEYPALDHFLTPLENVAVYASIHGLSRDVAASRANSLLERLGLGTHRDLPSHSLSAGLKQRVALARALVHEPELLLLDEPTSNLDPIAARDVRDLVRQQAHERGRTVLLSTHNLLEAQELCDRIAIIRHGRLLASGSLEDLRGAVRVGALEVTVGAGSVPASVAALSELPDAVVTDRGDGRSLDVRIDTSRAPEVVRRLVSAGVEIHGVRPEAPTLEDVYVSLHREMAPADVGPSAMDVAR